MGSAESTTNALSETAHLSCRRYGSGIEICAAIVCLHQTNGQRQAYLPRPWSPTDSPRHGYYRLISVIGMYCRSIPFSEGSLSRSPQQSDNYSRDNAFGG